jgi:hypothetical protein
LLGTNCASGFEPGANCSQQGRLQKRSRPRQPLPAVVPLAWKTEAKRQDFCSSSVDSIFSSKSRKLELASGFEQPCARVDSQGASTHRSPHAWLPATHTPTDRAHGRERAHHGGDVRYRIFSFFCMYVHALTCRHPCQRGGARGSHARVDLGDLLTARMSGAGCAGRSIIQQPPLGRRPSPLPEQSCSRSRRGRTCRLSLLGRACSISWRALSGVLSHISAQDRPVRDSI